MLISVSTIMWFFSHLAQQKYYVITVYVMMVVLMLGAMLGLILIATWLKVMPNVVHSPNTHYDYIIVGGGTAGCVLASRLSANPHRSVLLVEAGQQFNWIATIPLAAPLLQNTVYDWAYRTVPQHYSSWGLWNQSSAWPRGRGLGGSSQMNYLLHFPGIYEDFARWEALGVQGWSYERIQPYMEQLLGRSSYTSSNCPNSYKHLLMSFRNYSCEEYCSYQESSNVCPKNGAVLHVTQVDPENSPLVRAFLDAAEEVKATGTKLEFAPAQSTVYNGQRWSCVEAYLRSALGRSNFHILLNTFVNKLLITEQNKVMGIEVMGSNGERKLIYARQEVILSAGVINTPQILMLSGIGPKQHLQQLGIPVKADLPVGRGLHDHLNLPLYVSILEPVSATLSKIQRPAELWKYMLDGKGYLASSAIVGVGSAEPNLGLVLFGLGSADEKLLRELANFKPSTFQGLFPFSHNSSQEGFVFLASCLQPHSRGTVTLESTDPGHPPVIDPLYLAQLSDVTCMTQAVRLAARVVDTAAFERLGAVLHLPQLEECQHLMADVYNDEYVECVVRTAAITGHHPAGTCRMGSRSDPHTVVDSMMRVHGVTGLRVVDASVMPTPVSGHPNSVLMAIADRAASLISLP